MLSKDGGKSNLTPVIAFDLQSGDAAIFQRVLRKVISPLALIFCRAFRTRKGEQSVSDHPYLKG